MSRFEQQMFFVRKRSVSNKCFLCESAASATSVFCAKAQRQQQVFFARKRSVSNKCFLRESEASAASVFVRKRSANVAIATSVFCAKAQRQQQVFFVRKRSVSNKMLVTKALSQDVMVLAFVPLGARSEAHLYAVPKESPRLHSNQLIYKAYI
ncbi:hypothetical protein [Bacillus sp. RS11]|uniref:hypothetical protein n=1 Tax=Lysinibacillus sp. RS11 TaxID=3242682 RepID=UPI0035C750A2